MAFHLADLLSHIKKLLKLESHFGEIFQIIKLERMCLIDTKNIFE